MKKLLLLLFAVSAMAATSCKKDAETAPVNKVKVSDKKDLSTWD